MPKHPKSNTNIQITREEQSAQKPNARTGDNQDNRVPTHEGSQLGSPTTAQESESSIPHLNK